MDVMSNNTDMHAIVFVVRMLMGTLATAELVQVKAVTPSDGPTGTVDVRPMVSMVNGEGDGTEHGTVYGLPYFRLQGGTCAVEIDPKVGDIGVAIFCRRDISKVKKTLKAALPGSSRQFDWADGLYMGGFLNAQATSFIKFTDTGIQITDPAKITLTAPEIDLNGAVKGNSTADFTGDVTANGTSVHTHRHPVTTAPGTTGTPTP